MKQDQGAMPQEVETIFIEVLDWKDRVVDALADMKLVGVRMGRRVSSISNV